MRHDTPWVGAPAAALHPVDGSFGRLVEAFASASRRRGTRLGLFNLAGQCCRIVGAGTPMFDLLTAPLRHLELTSAPPDFTLLVWDRHSTGVSLPEIEGGDVLAPRDGVSQMADVPVALRQLDQGTFSAYAPRHRLGVLWADDAAACDRILPLRLFLHWWLAPLGFTLAHAGAVGRGGRGVLVTGAGGKGKSTSCVSALVGGLDYLGDDFVVIHPADDGIAAHSVSCSARFTAGSLARLPQVAADVADDAPAEDGKRFLLLHPRWQSQLVASMTIGALVVPTVVAGPASRVVRISSAEALRAMVSTLVSILGNRDEAFRRLAHVARQLPCHRLEAGADPSGVAAALADLVASPRHV